MTNHRAHARGFTLYEALAALVIAGIVLPVVLQAVSLGNAAAVNAAARSQAVALCESKLAELVATQTWRDGNLSGDFADEGDTSTARTNDGIQRYRWTAEAIDWRDASLKQLTVTVAWQRRGAEHVVSLSTLVPTEER